MTQVWARALAAGVDDAVFWGSTPAEVRTLVGAEVERFQDIEESRQRAANLRAGVIAAEVYNSTPGRRGRAKRATDYFEYPGEGRDSARNLRAALVVWGEGTRGVKVQ